MLVRAKRVAITRERMKHVQRIQNKKFKKKIGRREAPAGHYTQTYLLVKSQRSTVHPRPTHIHTNGERSGNDMIEKREGGKQATSTESTNGSASYLCCIRLTGASPSASLPSISPSELKKYHHIRKIGSGGNKKDVSPAQHQNTTQNKKQFTAGPTKSAQATT